MDASKTGGPIVAAVTAVIASGGNDRFWCQFLSDDLDDPLRRAHFANESFAFGLSRQECREFHVMRSPGLRMFLSIIER